MNRTLCLLFSMLICAGAVASPTIEYIRQFDVKRVEPIAGPEATPGEFIKAASNMYRAFLSKSSFSDLTIKTIIEIDSNASETRGYKIFSLELSDRDQNRFTGMVNYEFKTDLYEDPRTGKTTPILYVDPVPFYDEGTFTFLKNANGHVIVSLQRTDR